MLRNYSGRITNSARDEICGVAHNGPFFQVLGFNRLFIAAIIFLVAHKAQQTERIHATKVHYIAVILYARIATPRVLSHSLIQCWPMLYHLT